MTHNNEYESVNLAYINLVNDILTHGERAASSARRRTHRATCHL